MVTDINLLDPKKRYTYHDYLSWVFEDRVELIKGRMFRLAIAHSSKHQEISGNLLTPIHIYLDDKPDQVFHAPFDVRLFPEKDHHKTDTVVQPDLCIICDPRKIVPRGCLGAPDLVIEIISPSTSKKDTQDKFQLYAEAGVLEYWLVFPGEKIVQAFDLIETQYQLRTSYTHEDKAQMGIFPELEIDLQKVFL